MDKCIIFRSVLIYLLLCYGKKFVDANERQQTRPISHLNQSSNTQNIRKPNVSFPNTQNNDFQTGIPTESEDTDVYINKIEIDLKPKQSNQSDNLIILNIDNKKNTNEVIYELRSDGSHQFTCRSGYLIKEVRRENKIAWRPTNNNYADGMIFYENFNGSPKLTALIPDKNPEIQKQNINEANLKTSQSQRMNEIPSNYNDLSDIFVVDPNNLNNYQPLNENKVLNQPNERYASENYGLDFDSSEGEYINHHPKRRVIKEPIKRTSPNFIPSNDEIQIRRNQHNYESSGSQHYFNSGGSQQYFNSGESQNYFNSSGSQSENQEYPQQKSRKTKIPRPSKTVPTVTEVKNIIVLDVSVEDEGYEIFDQGDRVIFKAKPTYLFNKVKNGNTVVWQPKKPDDYAEKVIVTIGKNDKLKYDVVICETEVEEDEEEEVQINVNRNQIPSVPIQSTQPTSGIKVPEVNILTMSRQNELKVNDYSQYNITKHNEIIKYQFKTEARCVEIKFGNETVWRAETHCPLSITYNRSEKTFIVEFAKAYIHCEKHNSNWLNVVHTYGIDKKELGVKYNIENPRQVSDEETTKKDMSVMALKATAVVNIDERKSTNEFEFSKKSDDCGTYTPKHNFIFKVVKGSVSKNSFLAGRTVDIWHPSDEAEYVTKVIIDGVKLNAKVNNATLYLANGNIKHFTILNKNWVEVSPSIILNIENKKPTVQYDYINDRGIESFIPKGHFLFQGIKQSKGTSCTKIEVDIWETNNPNEYGTKVMVVNTQQNEKYLIMFLIDHTFKLFYKSGKESLWYDESTNPSTIGNLKLLGVDVADKKHYGIIINKKNKGTYKLSTNETSNTDNTETIQGTIENMNIEGQNSGNDFLGGNRINFNSMPQNKNDGQIPNKTTHTVRKVVVQHVKCDPNELYNNGNPNETNHYRTSSSEDSEYDSSGGESGWINLRH